jgi:hypothetical protein
VAGVAQLACGCEDALAECRQPQHRPRHCKSTKGKYPIRYLVLAEAGNLKKSTAKAKAM